MTKNREGQRGLLILAVIALSFALFYLCYTQDNKYTRPRPYSSEGTIWLEDEWYGRNPMFYLTDGWSFYRDKLLPPDQIPFHSPDAYLYIGRYGGFDLGNPEAPPHGKGTYRTVILTEGGEREYGLELTPIYSSWRLWINGKLVQSVGMDGESPRPPVDMVTFTAGERIEIVVEAQDYSHFYSGMVYPPAFGVPELVSRTWAARLLIHGGAGIASLVIGALCLCLGAGSRFSRPYGALTALCLCFCGSTAWPVFQVTPFSKDLLLLAERLCYYGMFLSMMWVQGRICALPKKVCIPACGAGLFICLSVVVQPWIPVSSAGTLYAYGAILGLYKWMTAFWLLATGAWALLKGRSYTLAMLAGSCVFLCALVSDRLMPLHEPVLTGWFAELAGGVMILLAGGVFLYDMDRTYKDRVKLKMEQQVSQVQLEARARYGLLQQEYVNATRRQLHETRNRITLMKHYLEAGEREKLREYMDSLLESPQNLERGEYTGHTLIDSILTVELGAARAHGIYVEAEGDSLPPSLTVEDSDLTTLLMNLLDNAIEACCRLPQDGQRWIFLEISRKDGALAIACSNSCLPGQGPGRTSKEDPQAHGYGMELMREAVGKYGGALQAERFPDSFSVEVYLPDAALRQG